MIRHKRLLAIGLAMAASAANAQIPGVGPTAPPAPTPPAATTPAPATTAPQPPAATTVPMAGTVATVNGTAITTADLDIVLRLQGPPSATAPEAEVRRRKLEALGMLIDDVLMRQHLEKNTPAVTPAEVKRRLDEMETALSKATPARSLAEFCQETNQTLDHLRARVGDMVRWSMYSGAKLTEAAVLQYYRDNKDFFDRTTLQVSHIVVRLPANATDADRAKAKETLEGYRRDIAAKKITFAEAARKYSQDPMAGKGGAIAEPITRKWYDEEFAKAAFALKVGEVSAPVQTVFGVHLIQVTTRNQGVEVEFAKIKDAVRGMCEEEMRTKIVQQLREEARKAGTVKIEMR